MIKFLKKQFKKNFKPKRLNFSKYYAINLIIVFILLALPFYLFEGKLYVGGDDTRLFYVYPLEFFKKITFFSWYKVSSLGIEGHNQYLAPFLILWSGLSILIRDKAILNYLAFSTPLILGFIYFQKSIRELFSLERKYDIALLIGSLFYILSPILIIVQMFIFLISIYLIGVIPIIVYYFLKYLKTSNFLYIYFASLWCFIFSFAIYAIPWLAGLILPLFLASIATAFLFKKGDIISFIKKFFVFFGYIFLTQAFWLVGFISTFINLSQDSFAGKFVSQGFVDTFTPTVVSTATGNIFYPMLNLFHRQIALDFNWKLINDFINFYDKTLILNIIFVLVLAVGLLNSRIHLSKLNIKIYILLTISFVLSIYFFTVNIGPLKDFFILLGQVPGFTMFRNFQDKFALGFVILYSSLITVSLVIITNKFKKYKSFVLLVFFGVIIINAIPIKSTITSPLWTTKNIYRTVEFPKEYLDFMKQLNKQISSTNNILSIPFGSSVYTVVMDENSNHAYIGVSPVKVFSGLNDISGHYSFNFTQVANEIDSLILDRKYNELNDIFYDHNINYVLVTKNIPIELRDSYIFNPDLYNVQDEDFINNIVGRKLYSSSEGNYELYESKKQNNLLVSDNIFYKKISPVKYRIYIKNLKDSQELLFNDSYHGGWKLFLTKSPNKSWCRALSSKEENTINECASEERLFETEDILFNFKSPTLINTHSRNNDFSNSWLLDKNKIQKEFDESYYIKNNDGSINIELVLYFLPQNYFFIGSMVTFFTFLFGLIYLIKTYAIKKEN